MATAYYSQDCSVIYQTGVTYYGNDTSSHTPYTFQIKSAKPGTVYSITYLSTGDSVSIKKEKYIHPVDYLSRVRHHDGITLSMPRKTSISRRQGVGDHFSNKRKNWIKEFKRRAEA